MLAYRLSFSQQGAVLPAQMAFLYFLALLLGIVVLALVVNHLTGTADSSAVSNVIEAYLFSDRLAELRDATS
ncbi:MAG: hypothetical protein ABW061_15800 [Polyangiaceae bacterium]